MYNERQRYQSEESFLPSRTNLVVKSLESIEDSIMRRNWDRVTSSFEETSEYLHELNTVAARKLSHFVVEPSRNGNIDIPSSLAAFFPKEKEVMDNSLIESYNKQTYTFANYGMDISDDQYEDCCDIIKERNQWCDMLLKEVKVYKEQKKTKKMKM